MVDMEGAIVCKKLKNGNNIPRGYLAHLSADCEKEWTAARVHCRVLIYDQMQQRAGRRKRRSTAGVTGGYTDVEECARGLVSQACGGNRVK